MGLHEYRRTIAGPALLVAAVLVASGCGSMDGEPATAAATPAAVPAVAAASAPATPPPPPAASPSVTPSPEPRPVSVTSDIAFASSVPEVSQWNEPLLDVYRPSDAKDLPLVVMFPSHGLTKDSTEGYRQLANAVAGQGAVVVIATWSQDGEPEGEFNDPAILEAVASAGQSVAACSVSFAVAHAGDYGADPSRVTLVGELYGANIAGVVATGMARPLPGCNASADWTATGVVGLDGDWLAMYPMWDSTGMDPARALNALSPWTNAVALADVAVELVVTDADVANTKACDPRLAERLDARDPSGLVRSRLDEAGALDDGCYDAGEGAQAAVAQLRSAGVPADLTRLDNPDGETVASTSGVVNSFGPADLALLADRVLAVAGRAAS